MYLFVSMETVCNFRFAYYTLYDYKLIMSEWLLIPIRLPFHANATDDGIPRGPVYDTDDVRLVFVLHQVYY